MHMKVKDLTPRRYESVYEIAYLLVGRASIFTVTSIMILGNFMSCVMFYMVLGETLSTLFIQLIIVRAENKTLDYLENMDLSQYPWWQ